MDFVES